MADYKIKITSQAIEHLKCIRDYIAIELSDPLAAKGLLEQIKLEMYSLQTMPRRAQCVNESPWCELGFRRTRVKNYYIYFWIDEAKKEVNIIAVVYTRRDQPGQLSDLA